MGNLNSGLKKYEIPFNLEEEESMYWLGYICADGCITNNIKTRQYRLSLVSIDEDIIEKFKNFLGSRAIYRRRKQRNISEIYINSRQLIEYLEKLNITSKKALTLNPNIVFNKHFVRGYFDGDGSVGKTKKDCKFTTGSIYMKNALCSYLDDLSIYYKVRIYKNAYYICIERKEDCFKFLDHIYTNSTVYMNRKYKRCVALLSNQ
jgi:DNA-binding transcriptional regulator WhiA